MKDIVYENHSHEDPNFPIIFHSDTLGIDRENFIMHYHENIEILYIIEGSGIITCGTTPIEATIGDTVIINSNELHSIHCTSNIFTYHCLIVDKKFCENFDISIEDITMKNLISNDSLILNYIDNINKEIVSEKIYFKPSVKAQVVSLLIHLCRNYIVTKDNLLDDSCNNKIKIVKDAISFIKKTYLTELTIDDICKNVGFSKYYLCRIFKEITGQTILDYINFLRCDNARRLLASGEFNVSESAEKSGFNNLSYFSKTYKKYMGKLPSTENKNI